MRIRGPVFKVSWSLMLTAWMVTGVARIVWWALRHLRTMATGAACCAGVVALRAYGPLWLILGVFVAVAALATWAVASPASFDRYIDHGFRAWWRRWIIYRRNWSAAMSVAELVRADGKGGVQAPRLKRVRYTPGRDLVRVRAVLGQTPQQWREAAPVLAHIFKAASCRVTKGDDRRLTLEFVRSPQHRRSWGDRPTSS